MVRCCHVNLNGLPNKLGILSNFIDKHKLNIIGVSESHLTSLLSSSFISIPGYEIVQSDVKGRVPKHGVCAYVHRDLLVDQVTTPAENVLCFRLLKFNAVWPNSFSVMGQDVGKNVTSQGSKT